MWGGIMRIIGAILGILVVVGIISLLANFLTATIVYWIVTGALGFDYNYWQVYWATFLFVFLFSLVKSNNSNSNNQPKKIRW
jgi:hypothetical protein